MQLDELKKSMTVLDRVLAKTSSDIRINVSASEAAQGKILKKYRQAAINSAILAAVFACLWIGNVNPDKLPNLYKGFIVVLSAVASGWYAFLFIRLKKIDITNLTPSALFSKTAAIKLLTLSGEIAFGLALAVFFTLLLSEMLVTNQLVFWLIIAFLAVTLTWSIIHVLPRYVKLFSELNTIRE